MADDPTGLRDPEPGAAYRHVLRIDGELAVARRPHLLTILEGEDRLHFDLEGRLHRAWLAGDAFQRGLDGRLRRVQAERGEEGRRWLTIEVLPDAAPVLARATESARRAAEAAGRGGGAGGAGGTERAEARAELPEEVLEPLRRAAAWDATAYDRERERFRAAYRPIPILPPDQNRALVVQLTEGCSWNRCTFCHLYRDVRFRLKDPDELRRHVRAVRELHGRALPLRRGIFLGQANALVVEQAKLLRAIEVVREELVEARGWPLGAFVDTFSAPKPGAELAQLVERGLESVALGLESGSAAVLAGLGKPAEITEAVELVQRLRGAGARCGVIVLVGAGGRRLAGEHVARTVATIASMDLGPRDRVYLSPLEVHAGSEYGRRMEEERLEPLSRAALEAQAEELRQGLRTAGVTSPIAVYDLRRFIY